MKVLIFDDHEVFLDGMKFVLEESGEFSVDMVLLEADFMKKISNTIYQLFILDFVVPGTDMLDIISRIQATQKDSKIIVLTSLKDKKLYAALKEKKVNGYIFKSEAKSVIREAIAVILNGEYFYSDLANTEVENLENLRNPFDALTEKEMDIIRYVAKGLNNKIIADELGISPRTVEAHKRNIDMKLGKIPKAQLAKLLEKWNL